jgi:hypothetical protein
MMPLDKGKTRVTFTKAELDFLSNLLVGYPRGPTRGRVWDKVWAAQLRLHKKQAQQPGDGREEV